MKLDGLKKCKWTVQRQKLDGQKLNDLKNDAIRSKGMKQDGVKGFNLKITGTSN